jgi:hypothetical protein
MADDYDEVQDQLIEELLEEKHEKDEMAVDNRSIYTVKQVLDKKTEQAQDDKRK